MFPHPAASQSEGVREEPVLENPITFILKVIVKKDSTELMLKALITRTHAPKPDRHHLKPAETPTECFLQYETIEAESKITGEKINGAPFLVEILEVEPQDDDDNGHITEHSSDPLPLPSREEGIKLVKLVILVRLVKLTSSNLRTAVINSITRDVASPPFTRTMTQ